MRVHFIAIGGAVMHNLAIALHKKGFEVSGSDDEIRDPSKSRLQAHGLLPENYGWFPDKISLDLDVVILGMHARKDNPELLRAQEIGLRIYSFPEYLFEQTKHKKRVVIGGSHGKTSVTSMVMHVLRACGKRFDYMVGSLLEGFDTMVGLSDDAEIAIFEGDEYLSSPIDMRPKFHLYKPHVALLTGIAWDHINVFPTFDNYKQQFLKFLNCIEPNGQLFYYQDDKHIKELVPQASSSFTARGYTEVACRQNNSAVEVAWGDELFQLNIFGKHNMQNVSGAQLVCESLGIGASEFFQAMTSFRGAARRLEKVVDTGNKIAFWDFAHAPSKLKATLTAVKEQYVDKQVVACIELHTFSSLNKAFLSEYQGALDAADAAAVFFEEHTLSLKRLPKITVQDVKKAFGRDNLVVHNQQQSLLAWLERMDWEGKVLLLMSSGSFGGLDVKREIERIVV